MVCENIEAEGYTRGENKQQFGVMRGYAEKGSTHPRPLLEYRTVWWLGILAPMRKEGKYYGRTACWNFITTVTTWRSGNSKGLVGYEFCPHE